MILVSGTKRSGTSMWMQILGAAGYRVWGEAFPRDWGESIRAANPRGFFESPLRRGVYGRTNPDPKTGLYLAPGATQKLVVKVFARGVARTERPFIGHVIASVRPLADYVSSMERLYALERAHRSGRDTPGSEVLHMPPALEWWAHNLVLLEDARRRGYALSWIGYEAVLRDPERAITPILRRLGPSNLRAALASVQPTLRTQGGRGAQLSDEFSAEQLEVAHALVHSAERGEAPDHAMMAALAEVGRALAPRIEAARALLKQHVQAVRTQREIRRAG
jgi:hypothetical protein